ncbi:MAG: patatin-like phospholipase family protein [Xanthomonadales bacterium]|jgi:NTE family protein|nr:patatin-like phospholipase family protein [Xanthomonadales bacterium]
MLRYGRTVIIALSLVVGFSAAAADTSENRETKRPRIGLVLGGGGAKGAAHIGVIRVLDELQIPVDCIAGTSMGALVGGTYAAGMPAAELEKETRAINWSETVGSQGARDRMPINQKLQGTGYTNSLEFGLNKGGIVLPGGLVKTQEIEETIRNLVNDARFKKDFDDLPIPFRAVATDMVSGEMVVLGSGDLSVAMRASMAVPGAFSPVLMGDQVLSDGGMVRNLPVDIARELCADVVIAVWLSTPQPKAENLHTAVSLIGRSMSVMIEANEKAQIATLTEDDIGISVPMGDIGTGDFQRVPDAIVLGRAAAEKMRSELSRYSVSEEEYLAWRSTVSTQDAHTIRIAEVKVEGLKRVNPEYVQINLEKLQAGKEISPAQISGDIDHLYSLGDFERVTYELSGPPGQRTVTLSPAEKSWGPNFLRFDLGLYADLSGELDAILRADHSRTWVNSLGASWNNALQLGRQSLLTTRFYQPLDVEQRFFIRPAINYESNLESVYQDGERIAQYYLKNFHGEVALGANVGSRAQFTAGLRSGWIESERDTGSVVLPDEEKSDETVLFVSATYDTRDNIGLPTRGSLIFLEYAHSDSWLGGQESYDMLEGVFTKAFPWRGDSLNLIVGAGATINGELPPAHDFRLGGIRSFPGLKIDELRGDDYWFAGSSYLWKLSDIQPLLGQALYAGLKLQAGQMTGGHDLSAEDVLYGISGSLNGRTPVGPFMLSLGYVTNGNWELQFSLGRPLPEGSALDKIH